jgi:tetratricopeptide (TPR) repeat protein
MRISARIALGTLALALFSIVVPPNDAMADTVELTNGRVVEGKILREDANEIVIRVGSNDLRLGRDRVKSVSRDTGVSLEESEGDTAMTEGKHQHALDRYEGALRKSDNDESKQRLEKKIEAAKARIDAANRALLAERFEEFERHLAAKDFRKAEDVLDRVEAQFTEEKMFRAAARANRARLHYAMAVRALDAVNAALARAEVARALELDDNLYLAHELAGRLAYDNNQPEAALDHFRKSMEKGAGQIAPDVERALRYRVAEILFQLRRYEEALPIYAQLRAETNSSYQNVATREVECLSLLGNAAMESGDVDGAIGNFQRAIDGNPLLPAVRPIRLQLGKLYLNRDQPELALEQFSQLTSELREQLQSFEVFYLIAQCHMRRGEKELAIEALRKELTINPTKYVAFTDLGQLEIDTSRYSDAEQTLERAIEVDSAPFKAYLLLGKLRRLQQRYDEAKSLFTQVLAKNDAVYEAILLLGLVYLEEKDFDKSATYFDQVIRQYESLPTLEVEEEDTLVKAYNGRGLVDLEKQQVRLALDRFAKAQKLRPEFGETFRNVGNAYKKLANYDRAEEAYRKAMELEPKSAEFVLALALLYHNNLNRHPQAIDLYYEYFNLGGQDYASVNKWLEELGAKPREQGADAAGSAMAAPAAASGSETETDSESQSS